MTTPETKETIFLKKIINDVLTDDSEKAELIQEHYNERECAIVTIFIIVVFILLCLVSDSYNKLSIAKYNQTVINQNK